METHSKEICLRRTVPLTRGTDHPLVLDLSYSNSISGGNEMAPVRISSGPEPFMMTPGQLNSGLAPSHVPATTNIPPTDKDLEILFQPMFG
ncbi:hypothetical protein Tco_0233804 [Tanacetum coccineum]